MKKSLLICLVSFLSASAFCQLNVSTNPGNPSSFTFGFKPTEQNGENYTINPDTLSPDFEKLIKQPRYRQYIEFGDGFFSNDFTGDAVTTSLGRDGNYAPFVLNYRIYVPWPPKATELEENTSSNIASTSIENRQGGNQQKIPANKSVSIVSSINSVIPGDVMVYAIPFKVPTGARSVTIVFSYNEKNKEIFVPLANAGATCKWGGSAIPAIRVPSLSLGERIDTSRREVKANIQIDVKEIAVSRGKQRFQKIDESFANSVAITIANVPDNLEHNVFITLQTKSEHDIGTLQLEEGSLINTAVLASFDNGTDVNQQSLPFFLNAHDPNHAEATPICFKKGTTQNVDFKLSFSNDGRGHANQIMLASIFDTKGAFNYKNIKIKKLVLAGQVVNTPLQMTSILDWKTEQQGLFSISIPQKHTGDSLFFTWKLQPPLLKGIPLQYPIDNYPGNQNIGYIEFTADVEAPNDVDSVIFSGRIKFNGETVMETPNRVTINVKDNCDGTPLPPCDSFWCRWWKWLLLALLILIAALVIIRRR